MHLSPNHYINGPKQNNSSNMKKNLERAVPVVAVLKEGEKQRKKCEFEVTAFLDICICEMMSSKKCV